MEVLGKEDGGMVMDVLVVTVMEAVLKTLAVMASGPTCRSRR